MTLRELFEHRSGRVIAAFRAVLVFVFFAALLLEPAVAAGRMGGGITLLAGYLALSLAIVPLVWSHWWFDQRLAWPMLVLDIGFFLLAVFLTEAADADFTSPFLAIFALTVLSAMLRWDWRAAARTGSAVIALFCLGGLVSFVVGSELDVYRFGRRVFYMAALLLVLVWFGIQRREPQVPPIDAASEGGDAEALMWRALDYARELTGAHRGFLAWTPAEEPWTDICTASPAGRHAHRAGHDDLASLDDGPRDVRLFDLARNRELSLGPDDRPRIAALTVDIPFAARGGISHGLCLPFRGASGSGLIVLGGIVGPGADHLLLGRSIVREISAAFDRREIGRLERDALVTRTRSAVARDLHDSVSQSLAGACFRLEALRRTMAGEPAPATQAAELEIVAVRDALRREQGHIRGLIEALRAPAPLPRRRDLSADLAETLTDAGAHWALDARLDAPGPVDVPGWLSHELQQLVREAVANAARHGHARHVRVELRHAGSSLRLAIDDDGAGFDAAGQSGPWSISERVSALGGELSLASSGAGTHLSIDLPAAAAMGSTL